MCVVEWRCTLRPTCKWPPCTRCTTLQTICALAGASGMCIKSSSGARLVFQVSHVSVLPHVSSQVEVHNVRTILQVAIMFSLYELAGVVTNLAAGGHLAYGRIRVFLGAAPAYM